MLEATADILPDLPDRITVISDYRCKDAIKACPGARWNTETRHWTLPLSWPACLALRAEFGAGLTIGPELRKWATVEGGTKKILTSYHGLTELTHAPEVWKELPGFATLYPHQLVDAMAIAEACHYLLLNETGTGKSRSVLAGLKLIEHFGHADTGGIFPLLIVAPKSMLTTWARDEVPNFFPDATVAVAEGTPTRIKKAITECPDVLVIGWESLRKYSRLSPYGSVSLTAEEKRDKELNHLGFKAAVFDEVHRCKNPQAKRTRAAWAVSADCRYRIGLSGSPIQESVEDLYGILHLLFPEQYPTKTSYSDRYLEIDYNLWGGRDVVGLHPARRDEFFGNFDAIHRRMLKEMGLKLPPKVHEVRWVEMPPKNRKMYNDMKDTLVTELETTTMSSPNQLVKAGRLLALANGSGDIDDDGVFHMTSSFKTEAFLDDVLDGDFDGQQVVVFSDSRKLLELLSTQMTAKKIEHVKITGGVTGPDRQTAMDTFQDGKVQFCLLTRAGGEGITLTAASVMVRLVRPWSYIVHLQVEDRVHRIGSEKHASITYIDYMTEDTIELGQQVRLNAKGAAADDVLRDGELLAMLKPPPMEDDDA